MVGRSPSLESLPAKPTGTSFGRLLREARLVRGMSQERLAEAAGISADAISTLERGHRKVPQRQTLELLLQALEPGAELRMRMRAAALRPSVPHSRGGGRHGPTERRGNLPLPLTTFFGRKAELSQLQELAARERLVVITGAGGTGKTRLAIEFAAKSAREFPGGCWFIELAPLADPDLVPQAVATALSIPQEAGVPLIDAIAAAIGTDPTLLIVDNCEHLVAAAAELTDSLLRRCDTLSIIATSRETLGAAGETVCRLPPLAFPPEETTALTADELLCYSAVGLFVERSRSRGATLTLSIPCVQAIGRICRRLDGIPLAIELAATKTVVLSALEIEARLDERFALLTDGPRTVLPRHKTLTAVFDWSFDLLDVQERDLFSRLAIFPGGFSLAAAEAVGAGNTIEASEILTLLSALVEKSLIVVDTVGAEVTRFRLLETTREYALSKLRATGSLSNAMRAHAAYVRTFAQNIESQLTGEADAPWLDAVEDEIDNVRTALKWTLGRGEDIVAGAEIVSALAAYWDLRSHTEGVQWLMAAHRLSERFSKGLEARVLAALVRVEPFAEDTFTLTIRSLEAHRALGDELGIATALASVGRTYLNIGKFRDAVEALNEGIVLARRCRADALVLRLLTVLGFAEFYDAEITAAERAYREATEMAKQRSTALERAHLLRLAAEIALVRGDISGALAAACETLKQYELVGDRRAIGTAHYLVAHTLILANRISDARIHSQQAIRVLGPERVSPLLAEALLVDAAVCARGDEPERAARQIGCARNLAAEKPFYLAFLIRGLTEKTEAGLADVLAPARFAELVAQGARSDPQSIAAESESVNR